MGFFFSPKFCSFGWKRSDKIFWQFSYNQKFIAGGDNFPCAPVTTPQLWDKASAEEKPVKTYTIAQPHRTLLVERQRSNQARFSLAFSNSPSPFFRLTREEPILNIFIPSGNIRRRSLKWSDVVPNFACLWPLNFFEGGVPQNFGPAL